MGASPNPYAVGTMSYWIHELQLSYGAAGAKTGKAEYQANLLLGKLPPSERRALSAHLALYAKAKAVSAQNVRNLSDCELVEYCRGLRFAGMEWPLSTLEGLSRRHYEKLWNAFITSSETSAKKDALDKFLQATVPWRVSMDGAAPAQPAWDPLAVPLVLACDSDLAVATRFTEVTFSRALAELLVGGQAMSAQVLLYCEVGKRIWENLPDDVELGDKSAEALVQAGQVVNVLMAISTTSLMRDLSTYADVEVMAAEARRTTGEATPMQVTGLAVNASQNEYWLAKLRAAEANIAAIKTWGPAISKATSQVEEFLQQETANPEACMKLVEILREIPYWEAQVHQDVCEELKATIYCHCEKWAHALLADMEALARQPPGEAAEQRREQLVTCLQKMRTVYASLAQRVLCEGVARTAKKLSAQMAAMDMRDKHNLLLEAIRLVKGERRSSTR